MKYVCPCGYVYDPEIGDPDSGIAPPEPLLKTFPMIGYVPYAAFPRTLSKPNKRLFRRAELVFRL